MHVTTQVFSYESTRLTKHVYKFSPPKYGFALKISLKSLEYGITGNYNSTNPWNNNHKCYKKLLK